MGEFDLIAKYLAPLATHEGALGLLDDATLLTIPEGQQAVITKDVMVAGVHFLEGTDAALVARKLLRVNLSDLAAMGAEPLGYWLGCQLPKEGAETWLKRFAGGLGEDQSEFGLSLMGGDTVATTGPLSLSLTAMGTVPTGQALKRSTANVGDQIWVSGTIGDGVLGLAVAQKGVQKDSKGNDLGLPEADQLALKARLELPSPRLALGQALRTIATAAVDISDGLVADAGHIADASNVGLQIEAGQVPLSAPAQMTLATGNASLADLLTGGDDFELLFTAPGSKSVEVIAAAKASGVAVTPIGEVSAGPSKVYATLNGAEMSLEKSGFTHF